MLRQRLVSSWRLLGKRPFGHPKFGFGHAKNTTKATVKRIVLAKKCFAMSIAGLVFASALFYFRTKAPCNGVLSDEPPTRIANSSGSAVQSFLLTS